MFSPHILILTLQQQEKHVHWNLCPPRYLQNLVLSLQFQSVAQTNIWSPETKLYVCCTYWHMLTHTVVKNRWILLVLFAVNVSLYPCNNHLLYTNCPWGTKFHFAYTAKKFQHWQFTSLHIFIYSCADTNYPCMYLVLQ